MSEKLRAFAALSLLLAMIGPLAAQQLPPNYSRSGVLHCKVAPSIGFIIGGHQTLACRFAPDRGLPEDYVGGITTLGLDIGVTAGGAMAWAVLTSTTDPYPGFLAGSYAGASGDIAVGLGVGANVLVGGSNRTVVLQPVSVEGEAGIDLTLGVSNLELRPGP
jgi:hypothetical protein